MKILFFNPVVWNYYRVRAIELPSILAKKGHQCIYINPVRYKEWEKSNTRLHNVSENEIPPNISVKEREINLKKSFLILLYENFDNVRMIKRHKPDAVIATDHLMSLFACIYCRIINVKFIFDITDDWEGVDTNIFTGFYWKYIAKPIIGNFSYTITSSSHKQAEVFKKYNSKTLTITNGKPNSFIEETEKHHAISPQKEVNFIAQLRDWYDFDLLFDVFKEFPDIKLNIYGKGEMYEHLLKKSEAFGNIQMLGNIDGKEVPRLTAQSLFGILPLKLNKLNDSTCPVKLFEYWAAKKVVVASPTYELQQIGKDCILFANSRDEYIEKILLLLKDDNLKDYFGNIGYKKVIQMYNYEKIGEQFEKIIIQK